MSPSMMSSPVSLTCCHNYAGFLMTIVWIPLFHLFRHDYRVHGGRDRIARIHRIRVRFQGKGDRVREVRLEGRLVRDRVSVHGRAGEGRVGKPRAHRPRGNPAPAERNADLSSASRGLIAPEPSEAPLLCPWCRDISYARGYTSTSTPASSPSAPSGITRSRLPSRGSR